MLSQRVEEVMSVNPLTVSPRTPVLEAASYMGVKNFRRMPVVEKQALVGMVSVGISIAVCFRAWTCGDEPVPDCRTIRTVRRLGIQRAARRIAFLAEPTARFVCEGAAMSLKPTISVSPAGAVPPLPAERMQALLTELGRGWAFEQGRTS